MIHIKAQYSNFHLKLFSSLVCTWYVYFRKDIKFNQICILRHPDKRSHIVFKGNQSDKRDILFLASRARFQDTYIYSIFQVFHHLSATSIYISDFKELLHELIYKMLGWYNRSLVHVVFIGALIFMKISPSLAKKESP